MIRFTCVVDASSYIYLSHEDSYSGGKTLLNLLSDKTNIKFSSEVNHEISHHYTSLMPTSAQRSSKVYRLGSRKIKTYKEYENRLFDNVSNQGDANRGEKHNLIVAIDHYLAKKTKGLIFLTDDQKALNGIIKESVYTFPLYQIWNSFDVILFLYIEHKLFDRDFAEAAIININAEMARNNRPNTDHKKVEERIKIRASYINRLARISKLLN